ncbi:MAG: GNAT family N-acetyltransferase, partial [bacterium]
MSIHIRPISSTELRALAHELADVMREVVDGGASLGFLTPLTPDELPAYWLSLIPEVQDGTRLVLVAFDGDRVVGSGQLKLASFPNAKHRAEVHKLFVANSVRRQGVGRSIMLALHDAALECGRSLI